MADKYSIQLICGDERTVFETELNDEEAALLQRLAEQSLLAGGDYSYKPYMSVERIDPVEAAIREFAAGLAPKEDPHGS